MLITENDRCTEDQKRFLNIERKIFLPAEQKAQV